jgi:hypothetical protein
MEKSGIFAAGLLDFLLVGVAALAAISIPLLFLLASSS